MTILTFEKGVFLTNRYFIIGNEIQYLVIRKALASLQTGLIDSPTYIHPFPLSHEMTQINNEEGVVLIITRDKESYPGQMKVHNATKLTKYTF